MLYPRTLYLLRHAEAVEAAPGLADLDRALTDAGRAHCAGIAAHLADIAFDTILCSAARRTVETAELALGDRKFQKLRQLYNAAAPNILAIIAEYVPSRATKVLVIAHNPGLSDLTRQFAVGEADIKGLQPGSMSIFEIGAEWNKLKPQTGRFHSLVDAAQA
jgi:phosphohistidine phosphatase